MCWRNAIFLREKAVTVVAMAPSLLAWAWPLSSEKLHKTSRPSTQIYFSQTAQLGKPAYTAQRRFCEGQLRRGCAPKTQQVCLHGVRSWCLPVWPLGFNIVLSSLPLACAGGDLVLGLGSPQRDIAARFFFLNPSPIRVVGPKSLLAPHCPSTSPPPPLSLGDSLALFSLTVFSNLRSYVMSQPWNLFSPQTSF